MKRLIIVLVVIVGLLSVATAASAQQTQYIHARNNTTNVRTGPGLEFPVIGRITNVGAYPVLGESQLGNWLLIEFIAGQRGYVHRAYVETAFSGRPLPSPAAANRVTPRPAPNVIPAGNLVDVINSTVGVTANLNIRTGPGLNNSVRTVIPVSTRVVPIARTAFGNWLLVDYRGIRGWVSTDFVIFPATISLLDLPVQ